MTPANHIDARLIDVFVSNINVNVDVLSLFVMNDEEQKKRHDDMIEIKIISSLEIPDQYKDMVICKINTIGENKKQNNIKFSCEITGVFYIKDRDKMPENPDDTKYIEYLSQSIYPYMRELMLDIGKRLPMNAILKLDPLLKKKDHTAGKPATSKKSRKTAL